MSIDIQKDKVPLNRITHSVRASQAVIQYGVGAMVDFPDQTLMTAAPEYWKERVQQIHDERLEKALRVDYFGMPGSKDDARFSEGISYVRFPEWYFCPKCRRFQPLSSWIKDYKTAKGCEKYVLTDPFMVKHMKCPTCRQDLVVARIITVCEHGHIDDFPWVKWTHCQNIGGPRKICGNPKLTFKTGASSTEGLEGLEVFCETCHSKATLKGAFDVGKFEQLDKKTKGEYDFTCRGRHPWKHFRGTCDLYPSVKQRGSSSVYFPIVASSLVIPPYSNILTTRIESSVGFDKCKTTISNLLRMPGLTQEIKDTIIEGQISQFSGEIALEIGTSVEQVTSVLHRKWRKTDENEDSIEGVKYRSEEYDALSGALSVATEEYGDFVREETSASDYSLPYIKQIALIHKIREVQALVGFSRVNPVEKTSIAQSNDYVSVKEPSTNWYPAYQVKGEGIFVEFDSVAIRAWSINNELIKMRIDTLNENYEKSYLGSKHPRKVTSKFVLLHTIAHLLIKQLSFECGYSIASLKERIYCSDESEGKEMAGILIYTASGDSEGTLGGLVRQGRPDTFPRLFKKAVESARICSNDPVCSLSVGQGRDSLNLAACYSCTLIPETSCEEFNVFLDRGLVVGTYKHKDIGLFSNFINGKSEWKANSTNSLPLKEGEKNSPKTYMLVPGQGTDMRDSSYHEIWNSLLQWSDNPVEQATFDVLLKHNDLFSRKEKPYQDCDFTLTSQGIGSFFRCDLMWKKSKVVFFTEMNEEDYFAALKSDWTCFYANTDSFDYEKLAQSIKEN